MVKKKKKKKSLNLNEYVGRWSANANGLNGEFWVWILIGWVAIYTFYISVQVA